MLNRNDFFTFELWESEEDTDSPREEEDLEIFPVLEEVSLVLCGFVVYSRIRDKGRVKYVVNEEECVRSTLPYNFFILLYEPVVEGLWGEED